MGNTVVKSPRQLENNFSKYIESIKKRFVNILVGKYSNLCREDAEDVFMMSSLVLWQKIVSGELQELNKDSSAFLMETCKNHALTLINKKKMTVCMDDLSMKQRDTDGEYCGDSYDDYFQMADNEDILQKKCILMNEALDLLSEKERAILRLYYLEDKHLDIIALELGYRSMATVKTLKCRALSKLEVATRSAYMALTA